MGNPQLRSLEEAVSAVPHGALLVMAGANETAPMALVRELLRQGKRGLRLVTAPTGGINVDLLIGAGAVASLELSAVSLGEFGAAPHFRRAAERADLPMLDTTWPAILAALQAGAQNIPYVPVRGLLESDLLKVRPDYKIVPNPFNPAEQTVVVPALQPDVALLHGLQADAGGNVLLPSGLDSKLAALAADAVIVTVEELVDYDLLEHSRAGVVLTSLYVDSVVLAPFGAHPTACPGYYETDGQALRGYVEAATDENAFARYLKRTVHAPGGHAGYLELFNLAASTAAQRHR